MFGDCGHIYFYITKEDLAARRFDRVWLILPVLLREAHCMDYLKMLHEDSALSEKFDALFDFCLLDELTPREDANGRYTFTIPGMAFAIDGSVENITCWRMAPSAITVAKVKQGVS